MKLEGEDRERPWDEVTIVGGILAMHGCWFGASYFATSELSHALVVAVWFYSTATLLPLIWADNARIGRNCRQLDEEIEKAAAELRRLEELAARRDRAK
ncbi:MAG TPA: hypothetical protein VFO41_08830 [Alphaproteobacteria bacterium]|nr:hypothetical protein [Alphaproteobacteria bacterium]